jgi:type II secretory pathway component GspD/PulD (secretin)
MRLHFEIRTGIRGFLLCGIILATSVSLSCKTAPEDPELLTVSVPLGQEVHKQKIFQLKLRDDSFAEALRDIRLTAQVVGLEIDYTIIGDADIPLSITIEESTLDRLINRLAVSAGCLAVQRGNHFTIYADRAEDILMDEAVNYVYRLKALPLDIAETQIEDIVELVRFQGLAENNSITLTGPLAEVKKLVSFLETIDQEGDVVLIELLIVQYRHGTRFNWGFDVTAGQVIPMSEITYRPGEASPTAGFTYRFLDTLDPQFSLNLSMLVQDNMARVITNPHIAVKNGNEAEIRLEQIKWVNLPSAFDTDTNTTTYELREFLAGVHLMVTPNIAVNGLISLQINGSLSVFVPTTGLEYATDTNTITTKVNVLDGQTLIIGGLIKREETESEGGVPLLHRIPVLNYLFKRISNEMEYFETVLYITPHIYPLKSYEQLGSRDYIHYLLKDMADREKIIEENLK